MYLFWAVASYNSIVCWTGMRTMGPRRNIRQKAAKWWRRVVESVPAEGPFRPVVAFPLAFSTSHLH